MKPRLKFNLLKKYAITDLNNHTYHGSVVFEDNYEIVVRVDFCVEPSGVRVNHTRYRNPISMPLDEINRFRTIR